MNILEKNNIEILNEIFQQKVDGLFSGYKINFTKTKDDKWGNYCTMFSLKNLNKNIKNPKDLSQEICKILHQKLMK